MRSVQRDKAFRGLACAGTKWDSSEEGQLRPGLSESIAASLLSRRTGAPAARAIKARHRDTRGNTRQELGNPGRTSLVRALALHGVLRPITASHLASPLGPGRGVLIRSVSRRLGSVAYVHEDASPNEVSRFQPHPGCRRRCGVSNHRSVVLVTVMLRWSARTRGAFMTGLPERLGRAAPGPRGSPPRGAREAAAWSLGFPSR